MLVVQAVANASKASVKSWRIETWPAARSIRRRGIKSGETAR
jgi:hypothetical protein